MKPKLSPKLVIAVDESLIIIAFIILVASGNTAVEHIEVDERATTVSSRKTILKVGYVDHITDQVLGANPIFWRTRYECLYSQ